VRRWLKIGMFFLAGLAVLLLAVLAVLQSGWLRDRVRERIVAEIENATGGRVELAAFDFSLRRLEAEVRGLVIHGTEGPGEAPLFRARAIRVGLKMLSVVWPKADLQSLEVDTPETNLTFHPDGSANLPAPKVGRPRRDPLELILNLAVKRFRLVNGAVRAGWRRIPAEIEGENLRVQVAYEQAGPRYRGDLAVTRLRAMAGRGGPLWLDLQAQWALEKNRLEVGRFRADWDGSHLEARGALTEFKAPRAAFDYTASLAMRKVAPLTGIGALQPRGRVTLEGRGAYGSGSGYTVGGQLKAEGLAFRERGVRVEDVGLTGRFELTPEKLTLPEMVVTALRGRFTGQAEVRRWEEFRVGGKAAGFALEELTGFTGVRRMAWSGFMNGPVQLTGRLQRGAVRDLVVSAQAAVTPGAGPNPLEGFADVTYRQREGRVELGQSWLAMSSSRAEFTGTLGQRLEVEVRSKDLEDFQPGMILVTAKPAVMPVKLANGEARFQGVISGPLANPEIRGRAAASNLVFEGRTFEKVEARVTVAHDRAEAEDVLVSQRRMRLRGTVRVGLEKWSATKDQPVAGSFTLRAPELAELLAEAGRKEPAAGDLTAAVALTGTVGAPGGTARVTIVKGSAFEQPIERLDAQARYSTGLLEVLSAAAQVGRGQVEASAAWRHAKEDARRGELQFDVTARGVRLAEVRAVQQNSPGLEGEVEGRLNGRLGLALQGASVQVLNGQVRLRNLAVEQTALGSLLLSAATGGRTLSLNLTGALLGSAIHGASECVLEGSYPMQGSVEFERMNFTTLRARLGPRERRRPLPFEGYLAGRARFSGQALEPASWQAAIELPAVEVVPRLAAATAAGGAELSLRNRGPVRVDVDRKGATIRKAEWSAPGTEVSASGTVTFRSRSPWNLRLQGTVDLAALRNLEPELTSSGRLLLDVLFRGPLEKPEVFGRAEIQNGALYLPSLPNGLDNINAVALLHRDRATLDRFSAESGGGKVSVSGFVGFGSVVTYYLQGRAEQVRYRDPTGASVTSNASLSLTGTSESSVLGGEATITRISFNPQTDLGSLLAASAQPARPPSRAGPFTEGIRFDVRVRTSSQARLETALTRGLQAEADLRVRGTPSRPVVLGRVLVNQGEVLFFGNKYTIDSGQIDFVNPARIEPTVKLDLQTKVRGVDVTLTLNGPVTQMNVTYRSDPPLQLADIVGLLATGRGPASAPGLVGARTAQSQSWEQAGASALMGQAIASPLAGRLQRFFGVSQLKIDPTISGVTGTPEARVTLEQQLSPTLTFTYIANLARAEQQSMRIEWGFSKNWSVVALREDNGLFGIDFLYKKRFK